MLANTASQDENQRLTEGRGLRPMVPQRDLRSVVGLIREGFEEWQSWRGRSFLSILVALSYTGPFLSLARISSAFRQFCSAIVCVDKGRVVGVIAGHPIGSDPRYWVIKNVVVRRSHQGCGLGGRLLQAVIEKAVNEGAEKAIGVVRVDNMASLNLASSDGFVPLMVTTEMRLAGSEAARAAVSPTKGLRREKASDWRRVYDLARATTPAALQSFDPISEADYRQSFAQRLVRWLQHLLSGQREHRLVAEVNGELAATLRIEAHLWAEHRVEMTVHPRWRGHMENMLIGQALYILARYPERPVEIKVPAAHTEAIEVLRRYGFNEKKTQAILGMDLRQFREGAPGSEHRISVRQQPDRPRERTASPSGSL